MNKQKDRETKADETSKQEDGPIRLYLAGPDVFLPEAKEIGYAKKRLCIDYGFKGLFPFDNEVPRESPDPSHEIYTANVEMIRSASGAIFNLTPFRGPSADVGTVFELGMCVALGKAIFAYSNSTESLLDRIKAMPGTRFDADTAIWRDADGMSIEDLGNADNLMIDAAFAIGGRRIHRVASPAVSRLTGLDGFRLCLEEAREVLGIGRAAA